VRDDRREDPEGGAVTEDVVLLWPLLFTAGQLKTDANYLLDGNGNGIGRGTGYGWVDRGRGDGRGYGIAGRRNGNGHNANKC